MLSLNIELSLFLVRPFNSKQLTMMIMQGLTLQLMIFGEDDLRGHTLQMSEVFAPSTPTFCIPTSQ